MILASKETIRNTARSMLDEILPETIVEMPEEIRTVITDLMVVFACDVALQAVALREKEITDAITQL